MQATEAVEDYLKVIYHLVTEGEAVTTSTIARRLGVSAPSVSAMVKRLEAGELVVRRGEGGLTLTSGGEVQALRVVRRHRLLETFLAEVVGVPWDEVHDEAEVLEHSLSDRLEDRIDALLGHPAHDPHGDPIPPRTGPHNERWADPLTAAPTGSRFQIERVSDRDPEALRYLADIGLRPGVLVEVGARAPFGGPLWITVDGAEHALGSQLTNLLHGAVVTTGTTPIRRRRAG
ncbi:MAG: metal-dependent transcriptional regulator [Geodermatophilaceae bacterium]|nr:metal-dependent transcriptional regulator [Geodermatophilaceae bacterium]